MEVKEFIFRVSSESYILPEGWTVFQVDYDFNTSRVHIWAWRFIKRSWQREKENLASAVFAG